MTATKIVREYLPSSFREAPRAKRRKTKFPSVGEVEKQNIQHGPLSIVAPSAVVSRALADHGLPDRLDPFSMDYLMDFDYSDGSRQCEIPFHIIMAIQHGNTRPILQQYKTRERLATQRNSLGETLLHLACRWGSVALIRSLLFDFKISAFVLDIQGRSPLHSLCMSINGSRANATTTNTSQTANHLESMRLLLRENASLILYKDKQSRVPLEYIPQGTNVFPLWKLVNELLCSERIAKRLVGEMMQEIEKSRSGKHMTMWEKINNMIDLSGLDAAIMETGLSV